MMVSSRPEPSQTPLNTLTRNEQMLENREMNENEVNDYYNKLSTLVTDIGRKGFISGVLYGVTTVEITGSMSREMAEKLWEISDFKSKLGEMILKIENTRHEQLQRRKHKDAAQGDSPVKSHSASPWSG